MSSDIISNLKSQMIRLHDQKAAIELEANSIISELETHPKPGVPPMGIKTPLVDSEGYPRADIDIHRARTLRGRLATLKTDHNNINKELERLLVQYSALQRGQELYQLEQTEKLARGQNKPKPKYDPVSGKWVVYNWDGSIAGAGAAPEATQETHAPHDQTLTPSASSETQPTGTPPLITPTRRPFARVTTVDADSPAHAAGLQPNDRLASFGDLTIDTPNVMACIAELVPARQGADVAVTVLRGVPGAETQHQLSLRPQTWSGRGLIGCHIVPLS